MGSRIGRRVIHFANLPIKLQLPKTRTNITEFSLKTIPSASKIEIKRVLESLYGFQVEKVRTLNMEGKKKKRGGVLFAKPDYKKAYVTLRNSLSLYPDLFPIQVVEDEKERANKQKREGVLEEEKKLHWLENRASGSGLADVAREGKRGRRKEGRVVEREQHVRFPWSSMKAANAK